MLGIVDIARDVAGWIFFLSGGLFILAGAIGVVRFPDFYTRMHAAGVTDTLGAELMLIGMAVQTDNVLIIIKLVFIAFFLFMTSPVATHSVAHAAFVAKIKPRLGPIGPDAPQMNQSNAATAASDQQA